MDKDIVRSLKGMSVKKAKSITNLDDYSTWGIAKTTKKDGYIKVDRNNAPGGWGIVSNKIGYVKENEEYILEIIYRTNDIERFSYNYFISNDGNATIGTIQCIADGRWHKHKEVISTNKDRENCGMLIGTDYRNTTGENFDIKNIKLYSANNPDLEMTHVTEALIKKDGRWVKTINRLLENNKWLEFLRPVIEWEEEDLYIKNKQEINIWQINDNLIEFEQIHNSASSFDKSNFKENGEIIIGCSGRFHGIFFRFLDIEPNKTYNLSYDYEVLDGELVSFGGHTDETYSNNECYLNGKKTPYTYGSEFAVYDKNTIKEKNNVKIVIKTPNKVIDINRLFIQPNRYNSVDVTVKVSNVKFEIGERATTWNYKE